MLSIVLMCSNKVMLRYTLGLHVYQVLLMYTSLYTLGVFINFHYGAGVSNNQEGLSLGFPLSRVGVQCVGKWIG